MVAITARGCRQQKIAPAILSTPVLIVGGGIAPPVKQRSGARPPTLRARKA
jgi:hypothetical protein